MEPLGVTPTQWPLEPSASSSHPSTRSTWRWGALVQGRRAAAPARRAGRGPRSQRGASRGATWESCAPSLQWRQGDRQSGAARPYHQPRASWSAGPDTSTRSGARHVVPPLDQEHLALGRVGPGPQGGCSGAAGREGTQVPEGR